MTVRALHSSESRPRLDLPRTGFEKVTDAVAILGVVATIVVTAFVWPMLPERIPTHFGFTGKPDGWGPRAMSLLLPFFSIVLYLALSAIARVPHRLNYPLPISAGNAAAQYRLARRMIAALKAGIAWTLAWLTWQSSEVSRGRAEGIGLFAPVLLVVLLAVTVVYVVRARRAA